MQGLWSCLRQAEGGLGTSGKISLRQNEAVASGNGCVCGFAFPASFPLTHWPCQTATACPHSYSHCIYVVLQSHSLLFPSLPPLWPPLAHLFPSLTACIGHTSAPTPVCLTLRKGQGLFREGVLGKMEKSLSKF